MIRIYTYAKAEITADITAVPSISQVKIRGRLQQTGGIDEDTPIRLCFDSKVRPVSGDSCPRNE